MSGVEKSGTCRRASDASKKRRERRFPSGVEKFRPAGVILDVDGLMLDTERFLLPLWVEAGKKLGWEVSEETAIRAIGLNGKDIRLLCMNDLGPEFPYEEFRNELNRLYIENMKNGIAHRPGLVTLLNHFSFLGIPLAVATSARKETTLFKLDKAGIIDRFTALACGDEVSRGKPAPDIFLLAAERLGKAPCDCVGFEDSPAGLQGLYDAGIRSVFIKDIVEPPEEILATVWRRCGDMAEAAEMFG
jgi:HAD superfamily hydrolase (TIGR01509 family)